MRFGFVGLGRAARLYHLPAVTALDGAEPVGGFDPSEQQRASWARETGMPAFASLNELLDSREAGRGRGGDTAAPRTQTSVSRRSRPARMSSARSRSSHRAPRAIACWRRCVPPAGKSR